MSARLASIDTALTQVRQTPARRRRFEDRDGE